MKRFLWLALAVVALLYLLRRRAPAEHFDNVIPFPRGRRR